MRLVSSLFFFALCANPQKASSPVKHLISEPTRRVSVDPSSDTNYLPKWQRGYFLRYDNDNAAVYAIDRSGKVAMRSRIALDHVVSTHIYDISASPSGGFAVAFTSLSSTGSPAAFIAWLDANGKSIRLIQLTTSAVVRLCFVDDGSLWALVREHDSLGYEPADYSVLRHYDSNGILIGSAVPRHLFATKQFPAQQGSLVASHDRIGLYADGARMWIELSYDGQILGSWTIPDLGAIVTRFHLSASNHVYVYSEQQRGSQGMLAIYRFDNKDGMLESVDTSTVADGKQVHLWGIDGEDLVTSDSLRAPTLLWSKERN
jgi:hypothetical protein